LLIAQMRTPRMNGQRVYTAGGGPANTMSLAQLTAWCNDAFGPHTPGVELEDRRYDVPWIAMDNRDAGRDFQWSIRTPLPAILEEIAAHARQHPEWLETSGGRATSRTRTAPN